MTRIRRAAAVVALAVGGLVVTATAAAAHAILLATAPADGTVLLTSPKQVSLRFDEAVGRPAYLTVTGPGGRVDAGSVIINGPVVSVKLRAVSTTGRYSVAYRVISDDGHPVEGTFQYQISGAAPAASSSSAPGASPAPSRAAVVRTAAGSTGQPSSGHRLAVFAGIAVVLLGAGALLWERLSRGHREVEGPPT
jgi:methionine-rich copper-binding protein CopC